MNVYIYPCIIIYNYIVHAVCTWHNQRAVQSRLRYSCLQFQVDCCWFPGVAPFLVGHLSGFLAHVCKSQQKSSVCLTLKKWKGSTIQPRDSLCVSHRGSKRQGVSSSPSHSHLKLERVKHTQVYILLVSLLNEPHWQYDCEL